jgi:hypothetical protein
MYTSLEIVWKSNFHNNCHFHSIEICIYMYLMIQLQISEYGIDNLHVKLIFDLGKKKLIAIKNLLKLVKSQNLVAKCCKIRKI